MLTTIPVGLDEIIATFGPLEDIANNLISFELPYSLLYAGTIVTHARCHKLAVDHFVKAFTGIRDAGFAAEFKEYNGIYAARPIRGQSAHPSTHSWGIAIDMLASQYPLGSTNRMPDAIVKIWQDAGFFYGGDFKSRKDGMHYQLATNY